MDDDTALALIGLGKKMPGATALKLMEEMTMGNLVTPGTTLNLSRIYRFLHQHNLMKKPDSVAEDRRKYEAQLSNDLWQADVMHGRSPHQCRRKAEKDISERLPLADTEEDYRKLLPMNLTPEQIALPAE